jgi:hypothetical protein
MSNPIIERRINNLKNITENSSLEEYFNLNNTENKKINFKYFINKEMNSIELHIKIFKKDRKIIFNNLPLELSDIISSYMDHYIKIKISIFLPLTYPFSIPIWNLIDVEHNIKSIINLKNYYNYLVEKHNNRYMRDWSAGIQIFKDILEFFQKINHFEYIF